MRSAIPVLLLSLALGGVSLAAQDSPANQARPGELPDALEQLGVSAVAPQRLDGLLWRLGEPRRVELLAQRSIHDWQVLAHCPKATLEDTMAALAAAACCEWRRVGTVWVLTDTPGAERLTAAGPNVSTPELTELCDGLVLSPAQAGLLQAGRRLEPRDLLPAQTALLQRMAFYSYASSVGVAPEVFLLQGVFLATAKGHPAVSPGEVSIFFPHPDGHSSPSISITFPAVRVARDSKPRVVPTGTPPALPPSLTGVVPRYPGLRDAALEQDTRLDLLLDLDPAKRSVFEALQATAVASGVDLVTITAFRQRKLELEAKRPSARAVLEAVARATGGAWKSIRGVYVLQSDPRLERAARLSEEMRPRWLREAATELVQRLEAKQRQTLLQSSRLQPEQLVPRQRDLLKQICRLAFAQSPGLDPKGLELKGVSLRIVRPKEREDETVLSCVFPSTVGNNTTVVSVPMPSR